ncbi:hypothetical protein B0T22DRAFT_411798 [Podospora appendiculata]|uniref:Chorismate synthase protein n=1 Tax=Podospora appendiculata TaxID=314037 RepID=A0AAE0X2K0_9PEZI|nr:hypothetical protein B0T22DRAFT_411798 [Podospora appendiculata]
MAVISWSNLKGLLIFFGPLLLPKAINYYRSIRAAPRAAGQKIRPAPPSLKRNLAILVAVAVVLLIRGALPAFAPENIFALTQSRLQIPADVLFSRLASLRPNGELTATDAALRARFVNLESRLLYLQFGPAALAECPFCSSAEPLSYLYYAIPALLAPHLFNLAVIAAVTSPVLTHHGGATWRTTATLAALALAALDVYAVQSYDHQANSRALRPAEMDPFFWTARVWRAAGLAALDLLLAALLYLSGTNRLFARPPSPAERVEAVARTLAGVKGKINAAGVVKNTTSRDEALRARSNAYWSQEVQIMREIMEDREVIEGVNDALENRIDIRTIERDAEAYATSMLPPAPAAAKAGET